MSLIWAVDNPPPIPFTTGRTVVAITQDELADGPHDFVAAHLLHWAQHLSISTQHFTAIYLLSHGAIKLALIIGLLGIKLWVYIRPPSSPSACSFFFIFHNLASS